MTRVVNATQQLTSYTNLNSNSVNLELLYLHQLSSIILRTVVP